MLQDGKGAGEGGSEDDAELDDEVVRQFHFGGGFVPKPQRAADGMAGDGEAPPPRRTKREVRCH